MPLLERIRHGQRSRRRIRDAKGNPGALLSSSPVAAAAIVTAAFFCFALVVLRPGYWINDDLKIIWNVAGYPGDGVPSPFMLYNNVLLGLMLAPLYGLRAPVNWYVLFLAIVNASSICALLYLIFASRHQAVSTLLGCTFILAGAATLTLNITYTVSAFLASISGICLVYASAKRGLVHWKGMAFCGVALILIGSLIRLPMCLLALLIAVPGILACAGTLHHGHLLFVSGTAAVVVFLGYAVDRLYVRAAPDWNAFYAYTRIRQGLHDSHRLNNVHAQIRRIGWTPNDQELFAHWFYPEESLYSFERIRYLVENISPVSQDPWGSVRGFLGTLTNAELAPFLLWMGGIVLYMIGNTMSRRVFIAVTSVWLVTLSLNLGFTIFYKDPTYVLASTLAGSLVLGLVFLESSPDQGGHRGALADHRPNLRRKCYMTAWTLIAVGAAILVGNFLESSDANVARQADYKGIRADLERLQQDGTLADRALIVSPAHGLPYEWSYPLTLDLPSPAYLDTGWITFSPSYYRVLSEFGITSLPDALVHREDVYLMAESSFTAFLARYFEQHVGQTVYFDPIYALPNPSQRPGYDGVFLYKLSIAE